MEPGVVQDDRDLLSLIGLARRTTYHEGGSARRSGLPGSGRSSSSWSSGSVPRRTTGSPSRGPGTALFSSPLGKPHAPRLGLVAGADLVDGVDLPAFFQQIGDLVPDLGHPPGDGILVAAPHERVGEPEAHAQKVHEQPGEGLGPVLDSELDGHDVLKGRDVPETGLDTCLRRRFTKNLLQLLLPRPLEPRRVPAHDTTDYHGAQPGPPPLRQPLAYRPLGPLDHPRDNIQADAAGSVQNRLRLHSHKPVVVRTILPPDEDVPLLVRHVDLHETILCQMLRKRQPRIPQQLPQNAILFNSGHSSGMSGASLGSSASTTTWNTSPNPSSPSGSHHTGYSPGHYPSSSRPVIVQHHPEAVTLDIVRYRFNGETEDWIYIGDGIRGLDLSPESARRLVQVLGEYAGE